jgi:branched-chain amino acid transport system ATP-binding protein
MSQPCCFPVLELRDLAKRVGSTDILGAISLSVNAGERIGIIGPNGAGKSTLLDLISGRQVPSSGQIWLNGQRVDGKSPCEVNRMGLSRSFQVSQLFSNLSVFENLRCGVLWSLGYGYNFWRLLTHLGDANERTRDLMHRVKLAHQCDTLACKLTYAEQRALELGITLASNAPVLLLDEPTAGMSRSESTRFMELLASATVDKTLLIVEHDMYVLFGLSDKVAVLQQGQLLAFDTLQAVRSNDLVQQAYLGPLSSPC